MSASMYGQAQTYSCSQDHRPIQVGKNVGGLLSNILLKPGSSVRRLDQVAKGIIWSDLKNLQGWRSRNLSGLPVAMYDCPCGAKDFVYILSEPLISTQTYCLSFSATYHCHESGFTSLKTSLEVLEGCCQVLPKAPLMQAEQAPLHHPLLTEPALQPQPLWWPLQNSLQFISIFLLSGGTKTGHSIIDVIY